MGVPEKKIGAFCSDPPPNFTVNVRSCVPATASCMLSMAGTYGIGGRMCLDRSHSWSLRPSGTGFARLIRRGVRKIRALNALFGGECKNR